MSDDELTSSPPRTLLGLGPPDPEPGDEPGAAERNLPETLRPWALPHETEGTTGDAPVKNGVPLRPLLPGWVKVALAASALVGATALGLALGRGPLAPRAVATAAPLEDVTNTVPRSIEPSLRSAETSATSTVPPPDGGGSAVVTESEGRRVEGRAETPPRPTTSTPSGETRLRARSPAAPALPERRLVADQARIEFVARAVRLDGDAGGSAQGMPAPDGG